MLIVSSRSRRLVAAAASVVCAGAVLAPPASAAEPEVVASGLNNPRQLSFTGDTLYVAEAGTGGDGPCIEGAEGDVCFGLSGSITRVRGGSQTRVLTGLASLADAEGGGALGPADVLVTGQQKYVVTMGLGNDPAVRDELGADGRCFGTVISGAFPNAGPRILADIGSFEADVNPDGGLPDTNPTGMIARGGGQVLTDSGGNSLLQVQGGHVSTIAVFDSPGTAPVPFPPFELDVQPVPTSVAVGPDGAYYVSELTGFPFVPGFARIHRVVPGQAPTVYADGSDQRDRPGVARRRALRRPDRPPAGRSRAAGPRRHRRRPRDDHAGVRAVRRGVPRRRRLPHHLRRVRRRRQCHQGAGRLRTIHDHAGAAGESTCGVR